MFRTVAVVAAVAALGVAACTPTYVAPRDGPKAQISLTRGGLAASDQAKLMVSNAEWSRRADIYGKFLYTYDEPAVIPAGEPLYMELQTLRYLGSTDLYCGSHFVFVPTVGHSYTVSPSGAGTTCPLTVTDDATGRAPDTLRVEPVPANWSPAD
jgi:hypothetical protein